MSSQELPVESVSVTGDPSGRAGSKMGAKPDSLTFCGILQTPQARRTGRACKFAVHRVELRVVHLQRVMQNIAREKGLLALRLNADGHVIKAVTGRGNEMHAVEHFAATAWDEARLSGLDHWQYAVVKDIDTRDRGIIVTGRRGEMLGLSSRHQVGGLRECRHPLSVNYPGIPAHMINMKMGQ